MAHLHVPHSSLEAQAYPILSAKLINYFVITNFFAYFVLMSVGLCLWGVAAIAMLLHCNRYAFTL